MSLQSGTLLSYRLVLLLLFPVLFTYTLYRAARDGGVTYLRQRYGFALPDATNRVWVHCASVGEINTANPLLELLQSRGHKLLVSTTTPTGKICLQNKIDLHTIHSYLPLDYRFCVNRFLDSLQPSALLLMETEIWPELISACKQREITVIIFNARLSEKTLNTNRWLRKVYKVALSRVNAVLARSAEDGNGFVQLGLDRHKLQTVGSLKFARSQQPAATQITKLRDYWLAASTHDNEELQIAQAWMEQGSSETLLVIAPRHPERRNAILRAFQSLTPLVQCRSETPVPAPNTRLFLLDTLGELPAFMPDAKLVFMGGSLISRGGHNPMEAAHAGTAILSGPSHENFREEFRLLQEREGCLIASNADELVTTVIKLLKDSHIRQSMGENAKALASEKSTIDQDYLVAIEKLLKQH